jgi:hypothetical protein
MSLLDVTEKFDAKNEILTIKGDIKNLNETLRLLTLKSIII